MQAPELIEGDDDDNDETEDDVEDKDDDEIKEDIDEKEDELLTIAELDELPILPMGAGLLFDEPPHALNISDKRQQPEKYFNFISSSRK